MYFYNYNITTTNAIAIALATAITNIICTIFLKLMLFFNLSWGHLLTWPSFVAWDEIDGDEGDEDDAIVAAVDGFLLP